MDYLATTYGPERLPDLVAALERHPFWDSLLPAVYGVSAAEVQTGWCTYLRDRFDVVCPPGDPSW